MKFSQNIGHPKFSQNYLLQQFERDFWNAYLYKLLKMLLIDYQEDISWMPSKDADKMSGVPVPLKTYYNNIWRLFVDQNTPLPNSIKVFQQKIEPLFLNIGTWKRWGNLCVFLEYTIEEVDSLISEVDKQVFITEIMQILTRYEVDYRLINGKFEVAKRLQTAENLKQLIENQLFIQSLHLKNITIFKDIEIQLDRTKPVTCFVGNNGSGKTTLLRAIAVGLIGATSFKPEELNLLAIRSDQKEIVYQKEGFIKINYLFQGEQAQNQIYFRAIDLDKRFNVKNGSGKSCFLINANDDLLKTLIIGFSQQTGTRSSATLNGLNPKIQDIEDLITNKPDGRFHDFSKWFEKLLIAPAEVDRIANRTLVERIFKVVNQLTQAGFELTSHSDTYIRTNENPEGIPIHLVSQGYKNVLAWFGFFMKRLWEYGQTLSFPVDDFTKLPAICLIDEIDTYLHPQWQQSILETLVTTFPNVQFMVTTHSPYVVGSIPKDLMQLYSCDKQTITPFTAFAPYGANIERITERIFETPARVQAVTQDVADLRKAIQNNEFEKAEQLFAKLEQAGVGDDDNDPEISSLKIFLRTKKRKAGL